MIGKARINEALTVVGESGNWFKIEPVSDSYGWVHNKFIKQGCAAEAKNNTIPTAEKPSLQNILPSIAISGQNIVAEGVVKPYGRFFKRTTSHKLILANKQSYLLKGDKKSLDPLNNRLVKITGIIQTQKNNKEQIIEIHKIEVLD